LWEPWLVDEVPAHAVMLRKNVKHMLTHLILFADFYLLKTPVRPALPDEYIWIKETELADYAKPRLIEILLDSL